VYNCIFKVGQFLHNATLDRDGGLVERSSCAAAGRGPSRYRVLGTLCQHEFAFGFFGCIGVGISREKKWVAAGSLFFEHSCFVSRSIISTLDL